MEPTVRTLLSLTLLAALALAAQPAHADSAADVEAAAHAYTLDVPQRLDLKVGETKQIRIAVVPNKGDHVSPEAPVSLNAAAADPFELPRAKLSRADSKTTDAQGIAFALPVAGKAKGQAELKATLVFYICVETLCAHQKRELSIPVQVE